MSVISFIGTPLGIVCVGIVSSIIGTGLYRIGERLYATATKTVKHKRFIKRLVSVGEMFCDGYTAAYAKYKSPFHQMLCVNRYIMNLLMVIIRILIVLFLSLCLLFVFQEFIISKPIIIAVSCVIIAIQYQKAKNLYDTYQIMFDNEFGDEYKKHMMEGVKKHWKELTEKRSNSAEA